MQEYENNAVPLLPSVRDFQKYQLWRLTRETSRKAFLDAWQLGISNLCSFEDIFKLSNLVANDAVKWMDFYQAWADCRPLTDNEIADRQEKLKEEQEKNVGLDILSSFEPATEGS